MYSRSDLLKKIGARRQRRKRARKGRFTSKRETSGGAPRGRGRRGGEGGGRGGMSNEIRYSISSDKRNCTFERSSSMLRPSNSVNCSPPPPLAPFVRAACVTTKLLPIVLFAAIFRRFEARLAFPLRYSFPLRYRVSQVITTH